MSNAALPKRRIEATLVYLFCNNKILMMERIKKKGDIHKNKWNGLGGKVELTESIVQCAVREVREESGLEVERMSYSGHLTFPEFDKQGNDWSVHVFRAEEFSGEVGECDEGRLEWINEGKLLDLNLWEGDRHFLPYMLAKRVFLGEVCYKDGKMTSFKMDFADDIQVKGLN